MIEELIESPSQVAYTVCLLPVTIARFVSFGGHEVPFWATVLADFIFNLQGKSPFSVVVGTSGPVHLGRPDAHRFLQG